MQGAGWSPSHSTCASNLQGGTQKPEGVVGEAGDRVCRAILPASPPSAPPSRASSPPRLCQFSSPARPVSPWLRPEPSGTSDEHPGKSEEMRFKCKKECVTIRLT